VHEKGYKRQSLEMKSLVKTLDEMLYWMKIYFWRDSCRLIHEAFRICEQYLDLIQQLTLKEFIKNFIDVDEG
jgi:hypothetical protein